MAELRESLISDKLRDFFPDEDEADKVISFLERGFSVNGEIVVASLFMVAKEHEKGADEVLKECEKEWQRSWKNQHPDLRGDPDAPGNAGLQSRASLVNIYSGLGISFP